MVVDTTREVGTLGAVGATVGVTEFEGLDDAEVPIAFIATTVKVYGVPFVRPVTIADVELPFVVVEKFPGDEVTTYEVIGEPPVDAGAVHVTVAWALPAVVVPIVGAPGAYKFDTVTFIVDVARLPAASVATADIVCEPLATVVESQVIEYGDVVPTAPVLVASM